MSPEQQNKAIDKIFVALAKSFGHTMLRNDIRSRVLDSQLSAEELSQLRDTHPLMRYIEIDTSELARNKRPVEKWHLKDQALSGHEYDLRHVFAYQRPPAEIL